MTVGTLIGLTAKHKTQKGGLSPALQLAYPLWLRIKMNVTAQVGEVNAGLRSRGRGTPPQASIQFSHSVVSNSVTPWTVVCQASLSIMNSWSLLKLMSIESVMPSNHLILCRSLLLLPSILPSIMVFSDESALRIRWSKYWSFSFNISPSNEHPGLISFRMDWLDLLAIQGTLKSLLQHHSSKSSNTVGCINSSFTC